MEYFPPPRFFCIHSRTFFIQPNYCLHISDTLHILCNPANAPRCVQNDPVMQVKSFKPNQTEPNFQARFHHPHGLHFSWRALHLDRPLSSGPHAAGCPASHSALESGNAIFLLNLLSLTLFLVLFICYFSNSSHCSWYSCRPCCWTQDTSPISTWRLVFYFWPQPWQAMSQSYSGFNHLTSLLLKILLAAVSDRS